VHVLLLILIGALAGYFATRLMRIRTDPLTTVAIGIAGALVGGFVLQGALAILGALAGLAGAVLGAVLLIWLWQSWQKKK
jgi:uncharacterized membrane protein YeaQ/YmgE (transglycosylase-associated protein family)